MSTISAPSSIILSARSTAAVVERNRPPSQKESGVTLSAPIRSVLSDWKQPARGVKRLLSLERGGPLYTDAGMAIGKQVTRRKFGKTAAAPLFASASALGLNGATPASDRIALGVIGIGGRNRRNLTTFLEQKDVRVAAVCDLFAERREVGKKMVDDYYGNAACAATRFHEEIFERADIDAVLIGAGDRWHAVLSSLAARAGKDVYCEKPFCLTIAEGRALVKTVQKTGAVWQCGTQRKSNPGYKFLIDVVNSGRIGKLHAVRLSFGASGNWKRNASPRRNPPPDPEVFDYDRWLGQAPWAPYSRERVALWRINWDTGGGSIADMGPHFIETLQWARGDEMDAPVAYEGEANTAPKAASTTFRTGTKSAPATPTACACISIPRQGTQVHRGQGLDFPVRHRGMQAKPDSVLQGLEPPDAHYLIQEPHMRNFLDCMRSRKLPRSHAEIAHRAHTIVHCANICLRLGRPLRWDAGNERFLGDDEANRMIYRAMRAPWRV